MIEWLRKSLSTLSLHSGEGWVGFLGYAKPGEPTSPDEAALQVQAVHCAVRVIAEGVASMPVHIKRRGVDGDDRIVINPAPDHWSTPMLTQAPNGWQTAAEMIEQMVMIAALTGDAIALKDRAERPSVLVPVPPGCWSVRQEADYRLDYTVTTADRTQVAVDRRQVVHLRGPTLNGYLGLPAVRLARRAIGLAARIEQHQDRQATNGQRPSGVLASEAALTPERLESMRAQWEARFGEGGSGGVAVLDGAWQFTPTQMSGVDAEHLETRNHQIEEIARAFRVFPQMLMRAHDGTNFASAESFFRAHVTHTLLPWVRRVEGALTRQVLTSADRAAGFFVDLDQDALLLGDFADRAAYLTAALGSGGAPAWMTQNEARRMTGLNPLPGGDRLSSGAMMEAGDVDDG